MLARLERLPNHGRLREDGQRDEDGVDVGAGEEGREVPALGGRGVVVDFGRAGGGGGEGRGGGLRARVDGLEGEGRVGFDGGEVFCDERLALEVLRGGVISGAAG